MLLTSMEIISSIYDNTQTYHSILYQKFSPSFVYEQQFFHFFAITIKITMDKIELHTEFK